MLAVWPIGQEFSDITGTGQAELAAWPLRNNCLLRATIPIPMRTMKSKMTNPNK